MAIPTSRAVQEIVNKLSSDKAKPREEGIKFLNTCLEGEGSVSFCKYLQHNTSKLKPNEIPHSETWPFLVSLLMRCVSEEVSASKRRLPKLMYAKTLRMVVQRAEGKLLPLLPVMKALFNHILDILGSVQSFQSEYGVILRHLLAIRNYRFHMRKRTYSNLVLLYMEKIEESLSGKDNSQYNPKEEVFRSTLTLHSLLENPPGDFPGSLREDVVKGFVRISSYIRDEGKVSRKLIECINSYLLKDGPNLGTQSLEIHDAVQQFIFRCWQTTHDRNLKDALILYARLQMSLTRDSMDGGRLLEQFLDVVCKELDESNVSNSIVPRSDMTKDDKLGTLSSSQCGLVELAAMVFYRACIYKTNEQPSIKRVKKECAAALLKDALMKGKYLWNAAFCCLIQNYSDHISRDLLIYWFEGICSSFERTMNDANMGHAYDGLLWTIRSLQELSSVSLARYSTVDNSSRLSVNMDEHNNNWQLIWSYLMHGLLIFSNVTVVADAALILLGNIISNDLTYTSAVPRDIWDLQQFRGSPSVSLLYFVSCYFSRRGSQGNLQEMLHLRKNLTRTLLHHLNWKESSGVNEDMVLLFPSALYALCAGCAPFAYGHGKFPLSYSFLDASEAVAKRDEFFDCSVEVLAKTDFRMKKLSTPGCPTNVHLPRRFMDTTLQEMESHLLRSLSDMKMEKLPLSNSFFICAVVSNFIYGSYIARQSEEASSFVSKLCEHLSELLDSVVNVIQVNCSGLQSQGLLGTESIFEGINNVVTSFRSLSCSSLFVKCTKQKVYGGLLYGAVIQSMERLLKALVELYEYVSHSVRDTHFEYVPEDLVSLDPSMGSASSIVKDKSSILDIDLDVESVPKDSNIIMIGGKMTTGKSFSLESWKFSMITLISSFFSIVHDVTWDMLCDLMEKECDSELRGDILYNLCKNPSWTSTAKIVSLVAIMKNMLKTHANLKRDCFRIVAAINGLLETLMNTEKQDNFAGKNDYGKELERILANLGDLMNKVAELDLLNWFGRVKLIDGICTLILLNPRIGQAMIDRLLIMLQDSDYRVRIFLARRIGILFQTWSGHEGLFQDIISSFGVELVVKSRDKLVSAREVIAAGPQPRPAMESVIITLMNLAIESEKVELEAVFMMCVACAIEPNLRELVSTVLDNLSRQLEYANRQKYLEQLMGPILFCWVSCGVSLAALIEVRHLFVLDAEPCYFVQYCCNWLLPVLILHEDKSNLIWVAQISGQPLAILIRNYFVPIFSVCMVLYSGDGPEKGKAAVALRSSILYLAEMSENERDKLIKKHMVAIVSHIFSLASCSSESPAPYMPKDIVGSAIRTVVDGFLEMHDSPETTGVVDQINIFRPDRVFTFILEMHYHIAAAVHQRHKCHRLAGIEVLVNILGHRAAIASTSNYLFNVIGQSIDCPALQEQCCCIISLLLETFKSDSSKEIFNVLGEQLQFLVSKLVACCISCDANGGYTGPTLSQVVGLIHQLTLNSDPYLHDYVADLEPFPDLDLFAEVRRFHQDLCRSYCPRQHLSRFVKRSSYLPPRLLLRSLQALHKKLLVGVTAQSDNSEDDDVGGGIWNGDHEMLHAVWTLVRMCGSESLTKAREMVSDFVSKIGIGDPHCVVFHLPEDISHIHLWRPMGCNNETDINVSADTGISEELMVSLLKFLKKCLMDDSVNVVDITLQALTGILSTEKGQKALKSFDSYERSLIEVHSRGVNIELVEKYVLDLERKSDAEVLSLDKPSLWETRGKTFEMWICPLVYSLLGYCNDVILRLCQDVVSLKSEIAEFLLPSVLVNLSGRKDLDFDLQTLISTQVQEHIFTESNMLIRSVQVWLNALNELRVCHVIEKSSSIPSKRGSSTFARPSSYGSKSRSSSSKTRDSAAISREQSKSLWDKVYWLSVDYLVVARSAIKCGSYFTSVLYVEHWCEEHFNRLTLGSPDFSHLEMLLPHIEILVAAVTHINEPDSLYGIIQSYKLTSQIITLEHEGNWSKALEYYDLQVRLEALQQLHGGSGNSSLGLSQSMHIPTLGGETSRRAPFKGLVRSLQQTGCTHVLDLYCQGLTSREGQFQYDQEFTELQYEAAWRAGNWDFCILHGGATSLPIEQVRNSCHFNEYLHSCLRALQEGDCDEFYRKLRDSKKELIWSVTCASKESTEYIYSTIIRLQILSHLATAWNLRWKEVSPDKYKFPSPRQKVIYKSEVPAVDQLSLLDREWNSILKRTQLHINLLEPFIAFRRVLLQILNCKDYTVQHLLQSATTLRKGSRLSQAAAALHEFKFLSVANGENYSSLYWMGRIEEAKLLRTQGQHEMAINLAKYVSHKSQLNGDASDVHRLVGKWLAEIRSSNSNTILEKYLKPAVALAENHKASEKKTIVRQSQAHFHLAHYADALFQSYEDRLTSNEWQAAMRLRKHKTTELEALVKRLRSSTKGEKIDYAAKIQELQKQLAMYKEEAEKLQEDRDNFLTLALEGYKRCLVVGDKHDARVVFRLISLWFSLSSRQNVINSMISTIDEVQSYKFVPLVYQIASRMGSSKDSHAPNNFQYALVSLLKKMAVDHPYHTIFQLLALANGDRIKDKQRSRNSFVVDMDKKLAAENLLEELSSYHGPIIRQMIQMVDVYIKLAELETRREDTNRKVALPRDIRGLRQLELVPVVTATFPVDRSCQYPEGSFPYFNGLSDSIVVMSGINAPKVVECLGSDGRKYRQLAKSGNDDLRQDAVMEQFFGLVNTFLQNHRDTWKRRLHIRTYKVVPFTPSAGVLEWVDGTVPLGEYLIGSTRSGGAHGCYGIGDWSFLKCREHMANEKDKRKAFQEVCKNYRPVMHYFFLERFLQPADWFEKRLAYTRSVAASSMVGYIVGLGDRHSMNILIDQATAEVVHIDLGVAFEQGLMLKTPERVPFRLTRDIIDGMGATGVEGVFRRCCEETLSVMRMNKEALLTIVEVFIHDPLYKWALSPLKALQRQKETDDDLETSLEGSEHEMEGNKDAARALMRVKQKLDGYDGGETRSVHGQVQQLIQDAVDPERLCQMFPGWGAWL